MMSESEKLAVSRSSLFDGMTGTMVLVRHGQSEGNAQNIFTGWRDLGLTEQGRREAREAAAYLLGCSLSPQLVFSSVLARARDTAQLIIEHLGTDIPLVCDKALNERNYGDLTGLNKQEAADRFGAEQIRIWRRSFSSRPPSGESLKDTVGRVRPYFDSTIAPALRQGKSILIVAHGNSLRALIMIVENVSPDAIESVEIRTGEIIAYRDSPHGLVRATSFLER